MKAAVKLESMPEEIAPRLLIADEDQGQVMALMTIYCIETLVKKHLPEKGIKVLSKMDAIKRVMKACRVPRKVAKKLVTIFEGDGSAWDTTCNARIREIVENPVINHVANLANKFMSATPDSWAKVRASICTAKNKERQNTIIDAEQTWWYFLFELVGDLRVLALCRVRRPTIVPGSNPSLWEGGYGDDSQDGQRF